MKKLILAFILFFFSTSVLYADPIEGSWRINAPKMKQILSSLPKDTPGMFALVLAGIEEAVFYKGGKLVYPKANIAGTWKRSGSGYQLLTDGDTIQAYLSGNTLKFIPPKAFPFKQAIEYKRTSNTSSNKDQKVKSMIRYNQKYYRTTKNKNGSQTYLIIDKKTCSFITPNFKGSGHSKTSDSCSVLNGELYMGPFLGKAQILSSNRIKHGKSIYNLRQHSSQGQQAINRRMIGTWQNIDKNTASIREIEVLKNGSQYKVHVFGACQPKSCDWGERNAYALDRSGLSLKATYNKSFAIRKLVIRLTGRRLTVQSKTHFTDGSGRKDYTSQDTFKFYAVRAIPIVDKKPIWAIHQKPQTHSNKLTPAQIRAKRLEEWYKAHPEQRPKK